jgi:hypothetical protein
LKSNLIAMAGVAIAIESERLNAERIAALEHQLEQQRLESIQREAAYREKTIELLNHIELVVDDSNWEKIDHTLWNAVTMPPEQPQYRKNVKAAGLDLARVKMAATRIRAFLAARGKDLASRDIISIHAESACILNATDLTSVVSALTEILPAGDGAI